MPTAVPRSRASGTSSTGPANARRSLARGDVRAEVDEASWRAWLEPADPGTYGVFVHQKTAAAAAPLRHFAGCAIPTVPTEYGTFGIVEAELALLRAALADTRAFDSFVLCSGACVPLKPFRHTFELLTRNAPRCQQRNRSTYELGQPSYVWRALRCRDA